MDETRKTTASLASPVAPQILSFAPPQLGSEPAHLAVLANRPGILALEKQAGIAWDGLPSETPAVLPALRAQLAAGKSGLAAFELSNPASIWPLDAECAGIGLVASRGSAAFEFWRNAFGSDLIHFSYELLVCADVTRPLALECALPVATHRDGSRAVISHETGRKSLTVFQRIQTETPSEIPPKTGARWEWWTAQTSYPRFHQIRIHAAECGLQIAGETLYAGRAAGQPQAAPLPVPLPRVEDFRPRGRLNKGKAAPLLDGIALRLAAVEFAPEIAPDFPRKITAPLPRKWAALRKRLPL